jgi:uncharacterized protein (TIGR02145 family)
LIFAVLNGKILYYNRTGKCHSIVGIKKDIFSVVNHTQIGGVFLRRKKSVLSRVAGVLGISVLLAGVFCDKGNPINNNSSGTVTDADGNVYHTVKIGAQVWTVENLKTTKYNDGTAIPLETDSVTWSNRTTPGYCWYNNDPGTYKSTYGALYNWYAVNTGKLAPIGWHVPTDSEWSVLTTHLGGASVAGGKLKEAGTTHWASPNTGATNETGFSALPGGSRYSNGAFSSLGFYGSWWSSTALAAPISWYRYMFYGAADLSRYSYFSADGLSVRCVKDN